MVDPYGLGDLAAGGGLEERRARDLLAAQHSRLAAARERLYSLRRSALPGEPTHEWRGTAQSAYVVRLTELGALYDEAVRTVESACTETARALVSLNARAG